MSHHVYQFGTISQQREMHEYHTNVIAALGKKIEDLLGKLGVHAALARDAEHLLNIIDPEWTSERDEPAVARLLRFQAWREMINFLEAHPEIAISDYHSLTIEQPDGEPVTPAFVESLAHLGMTVTKRPEHVHAELWFGEHDVKLSAYVKREAAPAPPAAEEQPPGADPGPLDPAAANAFIRGAVSGYEAALAEGVDPLAETAEHPAAFPRASREEQPIQVGDRVRVGAADITRHPALHVAFPADLEGREGVVNAIDPAAFLVNPPHSSDPNDQPIDVLLDGEAFSHCFAAAEVHVLVRHEDADVLIGQHA